MKLSRSYCPRLEVLEDRMTPTTFAFPIGQSEVYLVFTADPTDPVHVETPTCGPPPFLHECPRPGGNNVFRISDPLALVHVGARDAFVAAGVSPEQLAQVPPGLVIAAAPAVRGRA